ncbi:hypothetical protein B7494_g6732 [Chlorociboria aeruginascens]|nr:hypothetical protein B7494_g6732 [Chlorociboria aeruginascens]
MELIERIKGQLWIKNFQPIYARKRIDITWKDLWSVIPGIFPWQARTPLQLETSLEEQWTPGQTLATYAVRTGFDLCLQALAFPPGSEIIVSAVTIPDMVQIIKFHGLVPVPVDIQEDGSVAPEDISSLVSTKTKGILIAHLFGNIMPFSEIISVARKRELFIFEDCAQAFRGRDFVGTMHADVSMFSFGSIKYCTALGGALLTIRNPELLRNVKKIQKRYPRQRNGVFLQRACKYAAFKVLTDSSLAYGAFLTALKLMGVDHHALIRKWSRTFQPEYLKTQIRIRPGSSLLQLMHRRLVRFDHGMLQDKRAMVEEFFTSLPASMHPVGYGQINHRFWLCPVQVKHPDKLIRKMYLAGFDAADGGTSLFVLSTEEIQSHRSRDIMGSIVYVPMDHQYPSRDRKRLQETLRMVLHSNRREMA